MYNSTRLAPGKLFSQLTLEDAASTAKYLLTRLIIPATTFIQETIQGTAAVGGATVKGQLRVHLDTGMSP